MAVFAKQSDIFQGSDWLTYRWSAAQAYDTLDRIRDLCLQMPIASQTDTTQGLMSFDVPDEEITDMFGYIVELCDDLAGELDTFQADLFGLLQANLAHRWLAFEMSILRKDLRQKALDEAEAMQPSHTQPDGITNLVTKLKALIKQIDQ